MKVELSIKDDRELKNHIKEVIKGEVKNIARGEIRSIISEVFENKFKDSIKSSTAEEMIKEEIKRKVSEELKTTYRGWGASSSFIHDTAREYVEKYIKEAFSKNVVR